MNSSPSLVILAGGLGSRYKGSKQIDLIGQQQAFLLEFAIYDAVKAGFGKVVLIVNENVQSEMKSKLSHWESQIDVNFVLQALTPEQQRRVNVNRSKPWGTAQALLCAKPLLNGPFVVMNADDYYGQTVMKSARSFFQIEQQSHGLLSYSLSDTLSEYGGVSRGLCTLDDQGFLKNVVECHGIYRDSHGLQCQEAYTLTDSTPVSMNLWFFQLEMLEHVAWYFDSFFESNQQELSSECYLPSMVQSGIETNEFTVKVLSSNEQWTGLTFPEDKESVQQYLNSLTDKKYYPKSFSYE
jgi:NDP-sugar pyrophosphorylase family protein